MAPDLGDGHDVAPAAPVEAGQAEPLPGPRVEELDRGHVAVAAPAPARHHQPGPPVDLGLESHRYFALDNLLRHINI